MFFSQFEGKKLEFFLKTIFFHFFIIEIFSNETSQTFEKLFNRHFWKVLDNCISFMLSYIEETLKFQNIKGVCKSGQFGLLRSQNNIISILNFIFLILYNFVKINQDKLLSKFLSENFQYKWVIQSSFNFSWKIGHFCPSL
jgi:hypothetical protein